MAIALPERRSFLPSAAGNCGDAGGETLPVVEAVGGLGEVEEGAALSEDVGAASAAVGVGAMQGLISKWVMGAQFCAERGRMVVSAVPKRPLRLLTRKVKIKEPKGFSA